LTAKEGVKEVIKDEDLDGVEVVQGTAAELPARAGHLGTLERTFGRLDGYDW
jgi:hypothetical protein